MCLIFFSYLLHVLILNLNNCIISFHVEKNTIVWIYFQKVSKFKRVELIRHLIGSKNPLLFLTQSHYVNSIIWNCYKIFCIVNYKSFYFALPKLEILSFENHPLNRVQRNLWNIYNDHIESIYIYMLETYNQLFKFVVKVSHHRNACITNIQFVLNLDQEIIFIWILFIESNKIKALHLFKLIWKDIKNMIIFVINNLFYVGNFEFLIQINKLVWINIHKKTFIFAGDNQCRLIVVW